MDTPVRQINYRLNLPLSISGRALGPNSGIGTGVTGLTN